MVKIKPKKGDLLIAEPAIIGDVSFNRSIVLLADHSTEGSIGFILNKPLEYTINDLIPELEADFKVYNGGPVEQDNLYFIHKIPDLIPNSIEISLGIYWGGDFDKVAELIKDHTISEHDIKFFLGYSGWESSQLDNELKSNSWVVSENIYKNSIIEKDYESFWKEKMIEFGGEYSIWSNAPEDPSYN
ncbi:YqgE/AlgH family protein [Tamlana fucoidanivorans]|uniref:YqgE/AlgH family protein n=1 Tax=Allotamlana fucoidanivorans TaxID=2583814 RepID=A0A5C4SFZ4_9FLAO|nr:YqgE/AlgH family protein [Tamlana fucoidanivorans]TNJ42471.1 YqgE/AlgH family protein [Tamlana fucoidanivorans]